MSLLDDFLGDLDREWAAAGEQPVRLRVIGSSALMLRTDYRRGTKDADVLELREFGAGVSAALTRLAGKETRLHQRHRIQRSARRGRVENDGGFEATLQAAELDQQIGVAAFESAQTRVQSAELAQAAQVAARDGVIQFVALVLQGTDACLDVAGGLLHLS